MEFDGFKSVCLWDMVSVVIVEIGLKSFGGFGKDMRDVKETGMIVQRKWTIEIKDNYGLDLFCFLLFALFVICSRESMFVLKFQNKMRSKNCYSSGFEMSGYHCNLVGCVQCKLHRFFRQ